MTNYISPSHVVGVCAAMILATLLIGIVVAFSWCRLRRQGVVFVVFACGALYLAANKPTTDSVRFPYTDMELRYLFDAGSVVSNDFVHLAFTASAVLPSSAPVFLDYRPLSSTNDLDWVTYTTAPLALFPRPLDFEFENATSNRWICYTTWTPGPTVHTNGVAMINWQLPAVSGATNICAMLNTAIYTNQTKVTTR